MNATVGAAGDRNSMRVNVRKLGEICESRQLILKMKFVKRDGSPFTLSTEGIHEGVTGRAAMPTPVRNEENIALAGKELS